MRSKVQGSGGAAYILRGQKPVVKRQKLGQTQMGERGRAFQGVRASLKIWP